MPEGLAEAREGCAGGGGQPLPVGSAAEVRAEWRDSGRTASPESLAHILLGLGENENRKGPGHNIIGAP